MLEEAGGRQDGVAVAESASSPLSHPAPSPHAASHGAAAARPLRVAGTVSAVHAVVHAATLVLPSLLFAVARDLRVGIGEIAAAANAAFLAQALTALPGGVLADRLGPARTMALSAFGCGVGAAVIALAPSFGWIVIGLVMIGAAAGLHEPSGMTLIARGISAGGQGRAMGFHGVGGAVGEAFAPLLAATCAVLGGWRAAFAATSAAAAAGALAALSLGARSFAERAAHAPSSVARVAGAQLATKVPGSAHFSAQQKRPWCLVVRTGLLLAIGVTGAFALRGTLTFLPWHLQGGTPVRDLLSGAGATTLMLAAAVVAQLVGGSLADRVPRAPLLVALSIVAPLSLTVAAFSSGFLLLGAVAMFGFAITAARPVLATQMVEFLPRGQLGVAFGVQATMAALASSFSASVGGALATTGGGTSVALVCFAAVAIGGMLSAVAHAAWAEPGRKAAHAARLAPREG